MMLTFHFLCLTSIFSHNLGDREDQIGDFEYYEVEFWENKIKYIDYETLYTDNINEI